jgi:hypothetical protein
VIDNRKTKTASTVALPLGFRSTFFEGLTAPEIKAILAAARQERISPHQLLQQEGDRATRLWLPVTGRAAAYRLAHEGGKLFLRWGVPGDAFGLATIIRAPARYLVTVEAVQNGGRVRRQGLLKVHPPPPPQVPGLVLTPTPRPPTRWLGREAPACGERGPRLHRIKSN